MRHGLPACGEKVKALPLRAAGRSKQARFPRDAESKQNIIVATRSFTSR